MFKYPWGVTEDNLTGDFFGLMRHLPPQALLLPFVHRVQEINPTGFSRTKHLGGGEVRLWPEYEIPKQWRGEFNRPDLPAEKRRSKFYIVPDAVLHFDDCVFVIEAEKSISVEAEQLFQQYLVCSRYMLPQQPQKRVFTLLVNTDQIPPYRCRAAGKDDKTGISITSHDSIPTYIWKRMRMLRETCDLETVKDDFLWISWHEVARLSAELHDEWSAKNDEASKIVSRFLLGFRQMMDEQGFHPLELFNAHDPSEIRIDNICTIQDFTTYDLPSIADLPISIDPSLIPIISTAQGAVRLSSTSNLTCSTSHPKEGRMVTHEENEQAIRTATNALECTKRIYDLADIACEKLAQEIVEQLKFKRMNVDKWGAADERFLQRYGSLSLSERWFLKRYCFAAFEVRSTQLPSNAVPFILFSIATRKFSMPPMLIYGVVKNIDWQEPQRQWKKDDIEPFIYEIAERRRNGQLGVSSRKTQSKKGTDEVEFDSCSLFKITPQTMGDIAKQVIDWLDERTAPAKEIGQ